MTQARRAARRTTGQKPSQNPLPDLSAQGRLGWLLDFCGIDLSTCAVARRRALARTASIVTKYKAATPLALDAAQDKLKNFFTAMAHGQTFTCTVPSTDWRFRQVEDERRLPKSGKRPAGRWPGRIARASDVPGELALVLAAADLLDLVGAERLLRCPFGPAEHAEPCRKVFLATRRQRYCSKDHSQRAAWMAWLERQGGSRAKISTAGENVPANVPATTRNQPHSAPRQPRAKRKTPR